MTTEAKNPVAWCNPDPVSSERGIWGREREEWTERESNGWSRMERLLFLLKKVNVALS